MGIVAIVREVPEALARCELSFVERTQIDLDLARRQHEAYAEALERAGVRVAYLREPGMVHGYFSMGAVSPAAAEAGRRARATFKLMLE